MQHKDLFVCSLALKHLIVKFDDRFFYYLSWCMIACIDTEQELVLMELRIGYRWFKWGNNWNKVNDARKGTYPSICYIVQTNIIAI